MTPVDPARSPCGTGILYGLSSNPVCDCDPSPWHLTERTTTDVSIGLGSQKVAEMLRPQIHIKVKRLLRSGHGFPHTLLPGGKNLRFKHRSKSWSTLKPEASGAPETARSGTPLSQNCAQIFFKRKSLSLSRTLLPGGENLRF